LHFIPSGEPWRNGYVESFNFRIRDECLNTSSFWSLAQGLHHIKLHAARPTCATLMRLQGVPVAVIAAWIGHKDASLTMRLYAHSQFAALQDAGARLDRVVTSCDTEPRGHAR
jgi:integrase